MRIRFVTVTLLAAAAIAAVALSAQVHDHAAMHETGASAEPAGVAGLPPELRTLFKLEMAGLQGAMLELFPAVISGDWEGIARIAVKIRGGFVLAQQLTPAQREELLRALPAGFLERDAEFHQLATGLEHAAHRKQADVVTFYVNKLTEGCVGCHSRYATERFPALAPAGPAPAHAH